jgi:DNA-directed RNA polymerase subunit beta
VAYQVESFGKLAQRRNYSRIKSSLELPSLVEIQTSSFEWFLKIGLREVLEDIYPIKAHIGNNPNGAIKYQLDFVDYHFGKSKYTTRECKERDATYTSPLLVTLRLTNEDGEVSEQDVFMGDFPMMTPSGTFIINGAERAIVSQLVRSPGAYFKVEFENGNHDYIASLIPGRGTWLEFETALYKNKEKENLKYANVRIDRTKKMPISVILKALGLTNNDDVIKLFGEDDILLNTFNDRDTISKIEKAYLDVVGSVYLDDDNEDRTFTYEDGLKFIQQIYFQAQHQEFSKFFADNVGEIDNNFPREQLKKLIDLSVFKVMDSRYYKIVEHSIKKQEERLKEYLNKEKIDGLRKEIMEASKSSSEGNIFNTRDTYYLLTILYFRDHLIDLINANDIKLSEELLQQFVNLDYLFGYERFSSFGIKADLPKKDKGILSLHLLDHTIKMHLAELEIFEKLKPGETGNVEQTSNILNNKFFDGKRYDLTRAGRFKLSKKLNVLDRLFGQTIAEDIKDVDGKVICKKNTYITKEIINDLRPAIAAGSNMVEVKTNRSVYVDKKVGNRPTMVQKVAVYADEHKKKVVNLIGTNINLEEKYLTIEDILATISYLLSLPSDIGSEDDIDHLGNRRIKPVGELIQNIFRIGLSRMERVIGEKMSTTDKDQATAKKLTNNRPLTAAIKEFFASSQLSQFIDQTNPLAELTHKRRLSALGPGGLARDRAGMEVRDVHFSHYGRMCPIETPEGPNIGLINALATYAKVNEYGFIETPYRRVIDDVVSEEVHYLTADEEYNYAIAQANVQLDENNHMVNETVVARYRGENKMEKRELIDYVDVSPKQIVSLATSCIPFLENDDANRALMGANMQRQAVPLINPHSPIIGTGMEHIIAKDSGVALICEEDGEVSYVDAKNISIKVKDGQRNYLLDKFTISNQGTCFTQKPIVNIGEKVEKGQVLADGPAMEKGELALGQNVVVAFMTWNGYNYEDAIIMSERLVKEDVYTSVHIEEYTIESRDTKLGAEEITRDIPNISDEARKDLDGDGIIRIGAEVKEGDILVGKVTPKGQSEISAEERLLKSIFGDKSSEVKDNSLRVPHGGAGIILDIKRFDKKTADDLPPAVNEVVKVYVVQKRKISEGDKMAGRHGNKGVISKILPIEDMPHLADGTPVDIMLNPLGVPSRMNIGQIMEIHLGYAAKLLNCKIATPVFDGAMENDLKLAMEEANMSKDGKVTLFDGRTGEKFDEPISVGVMYMIKLAHMVDDKLHARSVGPYSLVTQQPLGGKAQNGGQRFGEMEVWALEAYGAAHTLQEILTVKSDDVNGRVKTYEAIVTGKRIPQPGIPESFKVLQKELQSLAIDVKLLDENHEEVIVKELDSNFEKSFRQLMNDDSKLVDEPQLKIGSEEEIIEEDQDEDEDEEIIFASSDDVIDNFVNEEE